MFVRHEGLNEGGAKVATFPQFIHIAYVRTFDNIWDMLPGWTHYRHPGYNFFK